MANFVVPARVPITITVSKNDYITHIETVSLLQDTVKNFTLNLSGVNVYKFTWNSNDWYLAGNYTTNDALGISWMNILEKSGTLGTANSTVSIDYGGTTIPFTYYNQETIGGINMYIYNVKIFINMLGDTWDWIYVLPNSEVGDVVLYCPLTLTQSRLKVSNLTSTSCVVNNSTGTRDQNYLKKWTRSGVV